MDRLPARTHTANLRKLDDLFEQIDVIEIADTLKPPDRRSGIPFWLRGYDAVHCASAEQLDDPDWSPLPEMLSFCRPGRCSGDRAPSIRTSPKPSEASTRT